MSQRVMQRSVATISSPVLSGLGDTPNPLPRSAAVTIYRSNGDLLVSSAATIPAGNGVFSYTLTPTDTALLDILTVEWQAPAVGTTVTTIDIVGGFLFSVPEFQALLPTNGPVLTAAQIVAVRNTVEDAIEEYTGAMVPRYARDTLSGVYGWPLQLSHAFVRNVRAVSVDGTALSALDVAAVTRQGSTLYDYRWPTGHGNIVVGYEHGRDRPPERIRRAAMILAKAWLFDSAIDDRASTFTSTEGGTFSLVTSGRGGSIFGVPEADAAVQANMLPAVA